MNIDARKHAWTRDRTSAKAHRVLATGLGVVLLASGSWFVTTATAHAVRTTPRCTTPQLRVVHAGSDGAAGTMYHLVRYTNTSHRTCTLRGYPGISFTDGRGHSLGVPARPSLIGADSVQLITLPPGTSAHGTFAVPNPGNYSPTDCRAATTSYLRVRPPDSRTSVLIPFTTRVCTTVTGRATVGPISAGPTW